jgi:hypothetical protein
VYPKANGRGGLCEARLCWCRRPVVEACRSPFSSPRSISRGQCGETLCRGPWRICRIETVSPLMENPVHMRLAATEQAPHFKRGSGIVGSKRTTGLRNGKRCNRVLQGRKPPDSGIAGHGGKTATPEWPPRRVRIPALPPEMPYFPRISARNSAAGRVRPAFTSS